MFLFVSAAASRGEVHCVELQTCVELRKQTLHVVVLVWPDVLLVVGRLFGFGSLPCFGLRKGEGGGGAEGGQSGRSANRTDGLLRRCSVLGFFPMRSVRKRTAPTEPQTRWSSLLTAAPEWANSSCQRHCWKHTHTHIEALLSASEAMVSSSELERVKGAFGGFRWLRGHVRLERRLRLVPSLFFNCPIVRFSNSRN